MTNAEKVLNFLEGIAPKSATNAQIRSRTGVRPHPQVFQITQRLVAEDRIDGRQIGKEWHFWVKPPLRQAS